MNEGLSPETEEKLSEGKVVLIAPTGRSMRPFLKEGRDVAVLKRQMPKRYDVILYAREDGSLILHRIIGCGRDSFTVCGDRTADIETVFPSQVLAVMTHIKRDGRLTETHCLRYKIFERVWCFMPLRRAIIFLNKKLKKTNY